MTESEFMAECRARAQRACEAFCRARVGPGQTFEFEGRTYTVGEDGSHGVRWKAWGKT